MENDSPNLFDSEPMTVQLTAVPENTADDVSAEIPEDDVLGDADGGNDVVDGTQEVRNNAVDYHTDDDGESDDENVDLNDRNSTGADQELAGDDGPADQLTETEPTDGSPNATAKDVHKGLPLGRVKLIMKMDPDVNIVAADAVYILTKATVNHTRYGHLPDHFSIDSRVDV